MYEDILKKINSLNIEADEKNQLGNKLLNEEFNIRKKIPDLCVEIIKEKQLLSSKPWTVLIRNGVNGASFSLDMAIGDNPNTEWKELFSIWQIASPFHEGYGKLDLKYIPKNPYNKAMSKYYNSNGELDADGKFMYPVVSLSPFRHSDKHIGIYFDDDETAIAFIKEWKLNIDKSNLENEKLKYQNRIVSIDRLSALFQ